MGTRSTTKIYNERGQLLLALYKQFDGYIEGGWGEDLKNFIKESKFVNGFNERDNKIHNGPGCFALQLVKEFKETTGGLYATTEDDVESYNYVIRFGDPYPSTITIEESENPEFSETTNIS